MCPKAPSSPRAKKVEAKVNKGDEIKLIVSKGKKITIPDFSKYSKEDGGHRRPASWT